MDILEKIIQEKCRSKVLWDLGMNKKGQVKLVQ